jgi:ABC-type sugar transport system ATPase subunit/ribose/xylose/arabinose/galactoside ABC-type transport system permease subunit
MADAVRLVQVSKSFPGVRALEVVSLTLRPGRVHALLGENGAGKSTLINLLCGVLTPDRGEILVSGRPVHFRDARAARRAGIVTVHQEVDLFADLSVAENMGFLQGLPTHRGGWIDWRGLRQRARASLATLGEDQSPTRLAGTLTPAQQQMVEIAAAVSEAARVLVLDEPTSSLSAAETEVLFRHLQRFRDAGAAILYVSHRLEEIFRLADEVTVLRDGQVAWAGPLKGSSPDKLIAAMVGRTLEAAARRAAVPGPVRLRSERLTDAEGYFQDVSLEARGGEVLGLYGLIGAGRSEWAQAVFGLRPVSAGEVYVGDHRVTGQSAGELVRQGVAYVPEDRLRQGLCRGLSVSTNVVLAMLRRLSFGPWLVAGREKKQTADAVKNLGIRLHTPRQPVGTLSGGNQQKVVLGRWLGCEPGVLILDEPTRGVDVGAKAEIHALVWRLAEEGRAVVLISSDLPEVLTQSDRVAVFRDGRLVAQFSAEEASAEAVAAAALQGGEGEQSSRGLGFQPDQGKSGYKPSPQKKTTPLTVPGRETVLLVLLAVLFAGLQIHTGDFLNESTVRNLLVDSTLLGFCAVGAALVILGGGIDISLGALMALSAGIAGRLWEQGYPVTLVLAVAIAVGAAGGLLNAGLALLGRVHPIVVTLGTMSFYRGLTLWYLPADVQIARPAREWVFAELAGLPVLAWAGAAFLIATWLLLTRRVLGRELYALGGNPAAARRVGIHQARVWLAAFALQGGLVGLSACLTLARSGALQATEFGDRTLEAIAAAVVGGVAIAGGRGSVWGVALGCIFLTALGPACVALHVANVWQRVLVGGVMLLAVSAEVLWRRRTT